MGWQNPPVLTEYSDNAFRLFLCNIMRNLYRKEAPKKSQGSSCLMGRVVTRVELSRGSSCPGRVVTRVELSYDPIPKLPNLGF